MKTALDEKLEKQLQNLCTNYANLIWNNNQELDFNVEKAIKLEEAVWQWVKETVLVEHDKEITGLIDGLIDEIQKGYYEISNPFDIAQYDKGYIKALTELKQKIGDL